MEEGKTTTSSSEPFDGKQDAHGLSSTESNPEVTSISTVARPVPFNYLQGWRLHVATTTLYLSLFLANFEISIVSTSLVAITNSLKGFNESNWIVTAYLVGYTGFIIIWAKLSDIFGRRSMQMLALFMFIVFSGASGAAQNVTQLIIFRAFQGIGGSGTYAVATVMCFELVPPRSYPRYIGMVAAVFAVSYTLGPVIGGAINGGTTWRWVFLLNVPAGVVAMVLLLLAFPGDYPYQGEHPGNPWKGQTLLSPESLQKVDLIGVVLLLAATVLLVCALEEAGIDYQWSSALVITFFVVAGLLWIVFSIWERHVTNDHKQQEPVFPWRFVKSRVFIGMLSNTFFVGAPYTIAIVQIPQRFQAANAISPLGAGIRLLPFTVAAPCGSFSASFFASKPDVPPLLLLLFAAALQIAGSASMSTLPVSLEVPSTQYGYQVLLGFGLGMSITTLLLLVPVNADRRDQSTAMGAITQFRALGGALGLAIVTSVMKSSLRSKLSAYLSSDSTNSILQSAAAIDLLPPALQDQTRSLFAREYNLQMRIVIGFTVAQFLTSLLIWKRSTLKSR